MVYLLINNKKVKVFKELDPAMLPWKELEVDYVLECTGKFTKLEDALDLMRYVDEINVAYGGQDTKMYSTAGTKH